MKRRKFRNAQNRLNAREGTFQWDRTSGYTAPGSRNPSKHYPVGDGFRANGARERSRKAVQARA